MLSKSIFRNGSRFPMMTVVSTLLMVSVTFFTYQFAHSRCFALLTLPIRLVLFFNQLRSVATTCADASLGRAKDVEDFSRFYSAEQMLQSRLIEGAASSHQMQGSAIIYSFQHAFHVEMLINPAIEPFSYTDTAIPSFPLVQSPSFSFDAALHPTQAVEYSTPPISGSWPTGALLWPHDMPVMEPRQSPSSVGLGMVGLWPTASSCPCVGLSTGQICVHQLFSSVAWVSSS
jgi:hypothetical protein